MKIQTLLLSIALVLFSGLSLVRADSVFIDAGPSASLDGFLGGNYVAGTEFSITASLQFNALGYLDAHGDGLSGDHQVGLWEVRTQTLIAQATVNSSSTQLLSAQGTGVWYLQSVGSSITLSAGTYRVAGITGNDSDADALSNDKIGSLGMTFSSGYVRTDYPNGGFAFPNLTYGSQAIRATLGNLDSKPTSVPDSGATLALLGLGVLGLSFAGRILRRNS
ncbi:MAG: VPDSG-CTERM sorting domain-containing protein [Opitutaceae bacterium]|nr:VPDSG-CTERM sorting domain-containing protein [Opitutaceae bacterium]